MIRVSIIASLVAGASAVNVPSILTPFKEYEAQKCPEGFYKVGHKCARLEDVGQLEVCPKGAYINEGGCFYAKEPQLVCPDGKLVGDGNCEIIGTAPGEYECPEGTTPRDGKCVVGSGLDVCPKGTALTPGGKCGKLFPKPLACPAGTYAEGDICVSTETAPYEQVCPEGTVLEGHKCVTEALRPEECPKGAADIGAQCAFFYPVEVSCPEGYEAWNGGCVVKEETDVIAECPEGGELVHGICKIQEEIPEIFGCQNGELVGEECLVLINHPVSYRCPTGYVLEDGKKGRECVSKVTYDCSVTRYECDPEKSHDLHVKAKAADPTELIHEHIPEIPSHLRHLEGDLKSELLSKAYLPSVHEIHDYCYKVPVVEPRTCEKSTYADPLPFCTEGVFNGKHKCEVIVYEPAQTICEGTIAEDGTCVLELVYIPIYGCPVGYTLHHKECLKTTYTPLEYACPEGTLEYQGQCAVLVDKVCPPGGCDLQLTTQPQIVCPVGYALSVDHKGGKLCTKTIYVAPIPGVCPSGTTEVGAVACGKLFPPVVVDGEAHVKPFLLCPVGYFKKHGECYSVRYALAQPTCEPEYIVADDLCIKAVAPVLGCPKGALPKGDQCVIEIKTKPLIVTSPVMKSPKELPEMPTIPKIGLPTLPTVHIPKPTVAIPKPTVVIPKPTVDIPKPTIDIPKPTVDLHKPTVTMPSYHKAPKPTPAATPKGNWIPSSVGKFVPFLGGSY